VRLASRKSGKFSGVAPIKKPLLSLIDQIFLGRQFEFVVENGLRNGQRAGVGHFQKGRDAASSTNSGVGGEVFFIFQTRFSEMNLRVDGPGQQSQTLGVNHLRWGIILFGPGNLGSNPNDLPATDFDISEQNFTVGLEDTGIADRSTGMTTHN
jgi:hypothetical protein